MRGLKPHITGYYTWKGRSHLLQMRGLKQICQSYFKAFRKSHLLQMRGLKQLTKAQAEYTSGRIFYRCVDWNQITLISINITKVASFTDAWIETAKTFPVPSAWCRIFYRCVDWNNSLVSKVFKIKCRIFYRCVDWNIKENILCQYGRVASFTDAWIETREQEVAETTKCRIFYRCVDWNLYELLGHLIR